MTARLHFTRPSVSLSLPEAVKRLDLADRIDMAKRAYRIAPPGQKVAARKVWQALVAEAAAYG